MTTFTAGMSTAWGAVGGQLLASIVILLSVNQDLGLRARVGATLGFFMVMAFSISALVTAIRLNLRSGTAMCAVVLCFEIVFILRRFLRTRSKTGSDPA
jgi:hypothetical protein